MRTVTHDAPEEADPRCIGDGKQAFQA
jgi:hypothetical protein